jgi:hypothetical protein
MAAINWKLAEKVGEPFARLIVTTLSSIGWRMTSRIRAPTRFFLHLGNQPSRHYSHKDDDCKLKEEIVLRTIIADGVRREIDNDPMTGENDASLRSPKQFELAYGFLGMRCRVCLYLSCRDQKTVKFQVKIDLSILKNTYYENITRNSRANLALANAALGRY